MVTAFVQFKLPSAMSRDQAKEVFMSTAPKYQAAPGLIRKYYLLSENGGTAGGVYLWQSKGNGRESLYAGMERIRERKIWQRADDSDVGDGIDPA